MKCANHPKREAEGACVTCGQLFCNECLVKVGRKQYCKECIAENLSGNEDDAGDTTTHKVKSGGIVITQQVTQQNAGKNAHPEDHSIPGSKSKTASVVMAVFLSYWTWLYTYKRDYWKFWTGLGLSVFGFILSSSIGSMMAWPIFLGIWIWAIIDTAIKDSNFYDNYSK